MEMNKLMSTAKKLDKFFQILRKFVVVAVFVMFSVLAVLTVANWIKPGIEIGRGLNVLDVGPLSIALPAEKTPDNATILGYTWVYAVLGGICAGVIYAALGCIRKILAPMTQGSPFHPDTARYLKRLAVLSLVLGVAQNVGSAVETTVALHAFGLDQLAANGVIESVTVNYSLELGCVVVFFLLLLMSYIFSYGAQLQQLSDETL